MRFSPLFLMRSPFSESEFTASETWDFGIMRIFDTCAAVLYSGLLARNISTSTSAAESEKRSIMRRRKGSYSFAMHIAKSAKVFFFIGTSMTVQN